MMKKTLLILALFVFTQTMMGQLTRTNSNSISNPTPAYTWRTDTQHRAVMNTIEESFESYTVFTLDFSPWTTADIDGSDTYGIEDHDFLHSEQPMAYIVFNPASTTPPLADDVALQAHTGNQFAACFSAVSPPNNDWLITPQISLGIDYTLSFWVKSYTDQYGLERYKVAISTTDNNPSSFTYISGSGYLEAPAAAWEQMQYDLSAYNGQQVYIAIQCVSDDAFIFMLDDIVVSSETVSNTLYGKVTDALTGEPISDALVSIADLSDTTDVNGDYFITGIPAGTLNANFTATPISGTAPLSVQFTDLSAEPTQTVTATYTGYTTYTNNQVLIPYGDTLELDIALAPELNNTQQRFLLSSNRLSVDIDSSSRNIISWNWNFGDGFTSSVQNPLHTYNSNGNYNVSLTVSDGNITKTETKMQYITVGPIGIDEVHNDQIKIYPNPVKDQLNISAESEILNLTIYTITGQQVIDVAGNGKKLEVNIETFPAGTYILAITTDKSTKQLKFNKIE